MPFFVNFCQGATYGTSYSGLHIMGKLTMIADKLSRHNQVIQTEWSLHKGTFNQICHLWHTSHIDLFATRFNKKLPLFMSPATDKKAWAVDALSISWEDMDGYAFLSTPLITNVINKILSHNCRRIIISPRLAQLVVVLRSGEPVN